MNLFVANSTAPDGIPHSVTSFLGLCCLPMSNKKDARLRGLYLTRRLFSSESHTYGGPRMKKIKDNQVAKLKAEHKMSRIMRKPDFCICETRGADQLCSNCTADQRLSFHH